jgi:hypothetical protein
MQALVLCLLAALRAWPAAGAPPRLAEAEMAFSAGLEAFQEGRDAEALELFTAAEKLDGDDGNFHYWRGLTLLRVGRAPEAVAELEACQRARRPAQIDPARMRADLDLARRGAGAGPPAPRAEAAPAPPVGAEPGRAGLPPEWRFERRPIDDRGAWEGTVEAGVAEDSNPNLLADNLDLPTPEGKLVRGARRDTLGNLGLRLAWYPLHDRAGWSLAAGLEAAQSLHRDFTYLDLGQVRAVVQAATGQDPRGVLQGALGGTRVPFGERRFSTLWQAAASYYTLNGATWLHTWDGAASFILPEARATATRLELAVSSRSFASQRLADERRTGQDLTVGLAQTFYLGRGDRTLTVGARGIDRRAHPAFAARALAGDAVVELPLALGWSAIAEGELRRDRYRSSQSNLFMLFGPARRDTTRRGSLSLAWAASPRWRWTARGTYGERTSNVDLGPGLPDLGYRRLVLGLGGSWILR